MGDVEKAGLYPRYCFHLSPTWPVWCFFTAAEIHALDKHDGFEGTLHGFLIGKAHMLSGEQFYFYKNLPVKWVRIVGLIVAIDDYAGRRVYTIDDSSNACIEVLETLSMPEKLAESSTGAAEATNSKVTVSPLVATKISAYPDIDVGHIVEVKGLLTEFRDERQINIEKMRLVKGTMEEVGLWEKRTKFRTEVLERPWELGQREMRKAQKEAERDQAMQTRKRAQAESERHRELGRNARRKPERKPIVQQPVNLREILKNSKGKYGALGL